MALPREWELLKRAKECLVLLGLAHGDPQMTRECPLQEGAHLDAACCDVLHELHSELGAGRLRQHEVRLRRDRTQKRARLDAAQQRFASLNDALHLRIHGIATHIEQLLRSSGKDANVAEMYEGAYRKAIKPNRGSPEFLRGSNWFQLGYLHAAALLQVGKTREAAAVCAELGIDPSMIRRR